MKRYIHDLPCWKPIKSTMCGRGRGEGLHTAAHSLLSLQTFKFHYPPGITNHGLKNDLTEHAKGQCGKWRKNWSPLMSPNSNHPRLHCALQTFHYLIDWCQRFHKQQTKTQKYTFPHIMNNNFYPTYVWV